MKLLMVIAIALTGGCRIVTVCTPTIGSAAAYETFMNTCSSNLDNTVDACKARAQQLGHAHCEYMRVYSKSRP
jgi:hypothetical protein